MKNYLVFLILAFCILSLFFINRNPTWDEAVYIGMGKYIFSFGKIGLWEEMRPILFPFLIGLFWKIGLNPLYVSKSLAFLFSVLCIFLIYKITKVITNEKIAIAASSIFLITPLIYKFSTYGLTGLPSTFFALFSIYCFFKGKYFISGAMSGLAFITRFPQGIVFLAILFVILIEKKGFDRFVKFSSYLGGFLIPVAFFCIFNSFLYGVYGLLKPILVALTQQANPFYQEKVTFYLQGLILKNPMFIFSFLFLSEIFKKRFYKSKKFLVFFVGCLFFSYFSVIKNKQLRFALVFLPYLSIIAAMGLERLRCVFKKKHTLITTLLILLCFITTLFLNFEKPIYNKDAVDFYSSLKDEKVSTVFSTIPHPVVYHDAKYFTLHYANKNSKRIFEKYINISDAAFYADYSIRCKPKDSECLETKKYILDKLFENFVLCKEEKIWGSKHYLFAISEKICT